MNWKVDNIKTHTVKIIEEWYDNHYNYKQHIKTIALVNQCSYWLQEIDRMLIEPNTGQRVPVPISLPVYIVGLFNVYRSSKIMCL